MATHHGGRHVAYAITGAKGDGVVRVCTNDNDDRTLLKGMQGKVKDVAFSYARDCILLGCVDEEGSLFVFKILTEPKLASEPVLQVRGRPAEPRPDDYHRIIWCPYLSREPEDGVPASRLLVTTRNNIAEMWQVSTVLDHLGSAGPHDGARARQVKGGSVAIGGKSCFYFSKFGAGV